MRGLKRRYLLIMNLFIILIFEVEERIDIYISIFIWKTHYRQVLHRRHMTLRN